jgi:peptide-methionine (R)-S-oxide reductase
MIKMQKHQTEKMTWADVVQYANHGNLKPDRRVEKTEDDWKEVLSDEQFRVVRLKGTEQAFSSDVCSRFEPGLYACICCDTLLFDAHDKFESSTGWPSFTSPIKNNRIGHHKDNAYGMVRIETTCNTCDAHLGHVFPDGPTPGGLRFCINAVSMRKVEEKVDQ